MSYGDFNLREYEETVADTNECKIFRQLFEELFVHQFVNEPTRLNSILDLILSDKRQLVRDIKISEALGNSDHNMIQFNISTDLETKRQPPLVPNFNRANFGNIK